MCIVPARPRVPALFEKVLYHFLSWSRAEDPYGTASYDSTCTKNANTEWANPILKLNLQNEELKNSEEGYQEPQTYSSWAAASCIASLGLE